MLALMRTTLTLEPDVECRIKHLLEGDRGRSFKEAVNTALRLGLDQMERPATQKKPYTIRPRDLGKCRLPNVDDVAGALAFAEGEGYR